MMLLALTLALAALGIAALRLLSYRRQLLEMARTLEQIPADSNLCLTLQMPGAPARRLCQAINAQLESGRQIRREALRGERELKYTMSCISHDIRTPLAGAMGYLQLLEERPESREEYLHIIRRRLEELEGLLEELFLYTRLQSGTLPLQCEKTAALPPLWDALAEFYPRLEGAGIQPDLQLFKEGLQIWANPEALGRIYRNLIANAMRHGGSGLRIFSPDGEICFSNPLGPGPEPDPGRLFDRFYQGGPARTGGGAGLGLSIVRELMEQMGGQVSARLAEGELQIRLRFASPPDSGG